MKDWQKRVLDEQGELAGRAISLSTFIQDPARFKILPVAEQERMLRQLKIMGDYSKVLDERIMAFTD